MIFPSIKAFLLKCWRFCRGDNAKKQRIKALLKEDVLIRTLFDSEHYNRELNILENNAIPTSDLKDRGLSLDIKRLASEVVVLQRVNVQKQKAVEKYGVDDSTRKNVYFSEVDHPNISSIIDENDGAFLFTTKYDPVAGNDAHAMLSCTKNREKRAYYVMARNKLTPIFSKDIIPAQEYRFLNK